MMLTKGDYKTPNEDLFNKIQQVYNKYFRPEIEYKQGSFKYANASKYGYVDFEKREFYGNREFAADEYVAFCGTHCDHIVIPEPYKSKLFHGLREAVLEAGNKIVFHDTFLLFLAKKPLKDSIAQFYSHSGGMRSSTRRYFFIESPSSWIHSCVQAEQYRK